MDCLRPDHLGCYGYDRPTSPTIDRIASEGLRFENYYCASSPCLPSRTCTSEHTIDGNMTTGRMKSSTT
ncbi:MAG: sulfatase-like hydrolase/transferase [Lentisphaerae bacterium]|nr:sulfatase-like hydrolase/transferase [Lentisphaerota bacterium]MBT4815752.1 sulfatase-like hydrolase/transferase [Lentisphaerota bacterium]MBT5605709.1 sulfatase-like hydrolase/transferase [Lentisphaerota bacterium]MBT7055436.1 sulfatase-like hydrolase/transferase [Lentisphaerota bacterium]MBT7844072.1 sulfatase-like hydrolase/transferase [Lentisphaerota bacterium]